MLSSSLALRLRYQEHPSYYKRTQTWKGSGKHNSYDELCNDVLIFEYSADLFAWYAVVEYSKSKGIK